MAEQSSVGAERSSVQVEPAPPADPVGSRTPGRVRLQSFHEQSLSVFSAMISRTPRHQGRGSVIGAICILMNAVLGASIIVLPSAYGSVGILTAILMELFTVAIAGITHMILSDAVDAHEGTNYQDLVGKVCGYRAQLSAQILLVLYTYGLSVASHITIGDQLEKVCHLVHPSRGIICHRDLLTPVASLIFVFPLVWVRNIANFSYASILSVASVVYLVVAIVVDYLHISPTFDDPLWVLPEGSVSFLTILQYLPTFVLGFQCHMTSVPLYYELHNRSIPRYVGVLAAMSVGVLVMYLLAAIFGLMTFGLDVNPDILVSYGSGDKLMLVSRVAIAVSVIASYPIFVFLGRSAFDDTVCQAAEKLGRPLPEVSELRRAITLIVWHATALTISCLTSNLASAISIVGSIAALFMLFYPGLILWAESGGGRNLEGGRNVAWNVAGAILMAVGVFIFLWTIGYTIYQVAMG